MYVYTTTRKSFLDGIFKNGFSRQFLGDNEGTDYGDGVYTNINLEDNYKRFRHTPNGVIVKIQILNGLYGYLIFNERFAKATYGANYSIKDQVYTLFPKEVADDVWKDFTEIMQRFPSARNHMHGRTAELLQVLLSTRMRGQNYRKKYDVLFQKYQIKGVIYRGNVDGLCLVSYDFGNCIPVAYAIDGKHFQDRECEKSTVGIANLNDMITLYHVTRNDVVDSIFTSGCARQFNNQNGNVYGAGVYTTMSIRESKTLLGSYGNAMIQFKLIGGFDNFLIFDKELATKIYGDKYQILDQLKYIVGTKGADELYKKCGLDVKSYAKISGQYKIRGAIYHWGNVIAVLVFDFSLLIPYSVSTDGGKTFDVKVNENNINRLNTFADVEYRYGDKYKEISEPVTNVNSNGQKTGYSLVKKFNGKFNYIDIQTGQQISPVDFDERPSFMHPTTGRFTFKCHGIDLIGCPQCFFLEGQPLKYDLLLEL